MTSNEQQGDNKTATTGPPVLTYILGTEDGTQVKVTIDRIPIHIANATNEEKTLYCEYIAAALEDTFFGERAILFSAAARMAVREDESNANLRTLSKIVQDMYTNADYTDADDESSDGEITNSETQFA